MHHIYACTHTTRMVKECIYLYIVTVYIGDGCGPAASSLTANISCLCIIHARFAFGRRNEMTLLQLAVTILRIPCLPMLPPLSLSLYSCAVHTCECIRAYICFERICMGLFDVCVCMFTSVWAVWLCGWLRIWFHVCNCVRFAARYLAIILQVYMYTLTNEG